MLNGLLAFGQGNYGLCMSLLEMKSSKKPLFCKLIRFKDKEMSQYMFDTLQYLRRSGKTTEFDKKSASNIVNYRWKDFLIQQEIIIPPRDFLELYNNLAENLFDQIIAKSKMIELLSQARDRLLPKLMSGEIEV